MTRVNQSNVSFESHCSTVAHLVSTCASALQNYLDSHKTIEKKRRDRINQCLDQLKSLIPDCKQYVSD